METYTAETLMANVMKLMKIVREKECTCSFWWDELEHFDFWHPRQPHLVSRIQDPLPTNTQTGLFETSMCWHLSTIIIAGQSPSPHSCHQHTPLPYYLYCYTLIYDNTHCQHVFLNRTQEENDNINNTSLEALCFPIKSTKLKAYAYIDSVLPGQRHSVTAEDDWTLQNLSIHPLLFWTNALFETAKK